MRAEGKIPVLLNESFVGITLAARGMPRCLVSRQGRDYSKSAYLFVATSAKRRASGKAVSGCYDSSPVKNLEGRTVAENNLVYKMIVLTRRVKTPGVIETMSDQVPEVKEAFADLQTKLLQRIEMLGEGDWQVVSHSHCIYNEILIVSFLISG